MPDRADEGGILLASQLVPNNRKYRFCFQQNLIIPKSEDTNPGACKLCRADVVIFNLLIFCMATAIKLNGESNIMAVKVENVMPHWLLATKFKTSKSAVAQQQPEKVFSVCLFLAKLPGKY